MTRSGRFLCPHCGNVFKSQGGLTMHMRWMHGERVEVSPVSTTLLDPRADMAKALEKLDMPVAFVDRRHLEEELPKDYKFFSQFIQELGLLRK